MTSPDNGDYIPSQEHRYAISPDPISQKRFESVQRTAKQLSGIPYFAGLTLFGSLSKGRPLTDETANGSDIDLYAFIDAESLMEDNWRRYSQDPGIRMFAERNYLRIRLVPNEARNIEPFADDEIVRWRDDERARLVLACGAVGKFVEEAVRAQLFGLTGDFFNTRGKANVFAKVISKTGKYSIMGTYDRFQVTPPSVNKNLLGLGLSGMFGMDIGNGLTEYRRGFFDELRSLPVSQAYTIWAEISGLIAKYERFDVIPPTLRSEYPTTLEEAAAYYLR